MNFITVLLQGLYVQIIYAPITKLHSAENGIKNVYCPRSKKQKTFVCIRQKKKETVCTQFNFFPRR